MNKFIGMGRLTKDPEVRYTNGQNRTCVANFSVAIDRRYKREGQPDADFFRCTAFGKTAEFAEKYLRKGTKVVFDAEVQNDNYKDKNGVQHYGTNMLINTIEFAESKKAAGGQTPQDDGFMPVDDTVDDDEIPFS